MRIPGIEKLILLFLLATLGIVMSEALGTGNVSTKPRFQPRDPIPLGFVIGKTTIDEAREIWTKEGDIIESMGYGEAKPSYIDKTTDSVPNKEVILFDFNRLPFEQLERVRFGFIYGRLYMIKYELDGNFSEIIQQLTVRLGPPDSITSTLMNKYIYTWKYHTVTVQFKQDLFSRHKMVLVNKNLLDQVVRSNQLVYLEHLRSKAGFRQRF